MNKLAKTTLIMFGAVVLLTALAIVFSIYYNNYQMKKNNGVFTIDENKLAKALDELGSNDSKLVSGSVESVDIANKKIKIFFDNKDQEFNLLDNTSVQRYKSDNSREQDLKIADIKSGDLIKANVDKNNQIFQIIIFSIKK